MDSVVGFHAAVPATVLLQSPEVTIGCVCTPPGSQILILALRRHRDQWSALRNAGQAQAIIGVLGYHVEDSGLERQPEPSNLWACNKHRCGSRHAGRMLVILLSIPLILESFHTY